MPRPLEGVYRRYIHGAPPSTCGVCLAIWSTTHGIHTSKLEDEVNLLWPPKKAGTPLEANGGALH